jgi:hypothetical protein
MLWNGKQNEAPWLFQIETVFGADAAAVGDRRDPLT